MSRSFFLGTDAEVYVGSETFSNLLNLAPLTYGVPISVASAYATLNSSWRAAYEAANEPSTRNKLTITTKNEQKALIKAAASEIAKLVNGTSTVSTVQKLALGLSVRETPTHKAPPGMPYRFKVTLQTDGNIEMTWKCDNPTGAQGTLYQIWRRTSPSTPYTFVASTGERKFVDANIPADATQLYYKVQGMRTTSVGPWATVVVSFGAGGTGAVTASVVKDDTKPKIAA